MRKMPSALFRMSVPRERHPAEKRVALSPETIKKFLGWGENVQICVERGAGLGALIPDEAYVQAGALVCASLEELYHGAQLVLKVRRPFGPGELEDELSLIPRGATLIGLLESVQGDTMSLAYAQRGIRAFSLDLIPRLTRAQGMDVLSSQSNLAGYRAVIEAAYRTSRVFPLMMTAAGTVAPVRVLVLGAGVAGLQAIATARRLGALVMAFDVRSAAQEQVESLGAQFIRVESEAAGEGAGGYATEMKAADRAKQAEKIKEVLPKIDVVICTALIPGKPAPQLISEDMLEALKPSAVIIDLAANFGGNCAKSQPGKTTLYKDIQIVGATDLPSAVSADATALYARNIFNFAQLLWDGQKMISQVEDEILTATCLTEYRGSEKEISPSFSQEVVQEPTKRKQAKGKKA